MATVYQALISRETWDNAGSLCDKDSDDSRAARNVSDAIELRQRIMKQIANIGLWQSCDEFVYEVRVSQLDIDGLAMRCCSFLFHTDTQIADLDRRIARLTDMWIAQCCNIEGFTQAEIWYGEGAI